MSTKENALGRRALLGTGAAVAGLGLLADLEAYPQNVNRSSIPSDLKITDMRIAVLRGPGGQAGGGRAGGRGGPRGSLPPATPGAGAAAGGTIIDQLPSSFGEMSIHSASSRRDKISLRSAPWRLTFCACSGVEIV